MIDKFAKRTNEQNPQLLREAFAEAYGQGVWFDLVALREYLTLACRDLLKSTQDANTNQRVTAKVTHNRFIPVPSLFPYINRIPRQGTFHLNPAMILIHILGL
jgi:hypothetical protein